jgi:DNA polymerase bacteriophage-type
MPIIFWDVETRSTVNLETAGTWRYASDGSTEVLCVAFAVDDAEPKIWVPGEPIPSVFIAAAADPNWLVVAHNYAFERAIETRVLTPRYGWPCIPIAQQRCSMALALANALPGGLDAAAAALGLLVQKDVEGHKLMKKMSRPLPRRKRGSAPGEVRWHDTPEARERLAQYCKQDVIVERMVYNALPLLSPAEQAHWELDAVINARGFPVDLALAMAARDLARGERQRLNAEIADLTDGEVTTIDQVARIRAYVERHGHQLSSLGKRSVSAVLAHAPEDAVRCVLELRREGARASARKLDRLLAMVDEDGRLRGTLRFHAAHTGRWSGRGYQPQNLKRPETADLDAAVDAVLSGDRERVRALGAPLTIAGDVQRSVICAAPGTGSSPATSRPSRAVCWPGSRASAGRSMCIPNTTAPATPRSNPIACSLRRRSGAPSPLTMKPVGSSARPTISRSGSAAAAAPGASSIPLTRTPTPRSKASRTSSGAPTARPSACRALYDPQQTRRSAR